MHHRCEYCFRQPQILCCLNQKICQEHWPRHFEQNVAHSFKNYSYPDFKLTDFKLADNIVNRIKILSECKEIIRNSATCLISEINSESRKKISNINKEIELYSSILNQEDILNGKEDFIKNTFIIRDNINSSIGSIMTSIKNHFNDNLYKEVPTFTYSSMAEANEKVFKSFDIVLYAHLLPVNTIIITNDNDFILTADSNTIKTWTVNPIKQITSHRTQNLSTMALSRWTIDRLFVGYENGTVGIIDTQTWKPLTNSELHRKRVNKILQLDENIILTSSDDFKIKISDFSKISDIFTIDLNHSDKVNCMSLYDDNKKLVSVSEDKNVYIWDLSDFRTPKQSKIAKLSKTVYSCIVVKNVRLILGACDGCIQIWDLNNLKLMSENSKFKSPIFCMQSDPNQSEFLTAGGSIQHRQDFKIRIWKLDILKNKLEYKRKSKAHSNKVACAIWSSNDFFITGSQDKTLKQTKGKEISIFPGHSQEIKQVKVTQDGKFIVSVDSDEVFIWITEKKSLEVRFSSKSIITSIASQKNLIFIADNDKHIRGYNISDKKEFFYIANSDKIIKRMKITNDSQYLATDDDIFIKFYHIITKKLTKICEKTDKNAEIFMIYKEISELLS